MPHKYVSAQGLENLRSYQYKGVDNSLAGRLCLNSFWNAAVELLPRRLAPNVVTLFGGVCMLCAALLCAFFAPHFTESVPGWALVTAAAFIWLYQTADNLDGKQARRTGAGSPLGELFDHGVDSLVMGLICVPVCAAVRMGPLLSAVAATAAMAPFYLSHWEEYHAGILVLGALTGPTELQIGVISLLCAAAALPADTWMRSLGTFFGREWLLNEAAFAAAIAAILVSSCKYAVKVWKLTRPGGTTVAVGCTTREAMRQPLVYWVFLALNLGWIVSTRETAEQHPALYIFATTCAFAVLSQRLIVQRICREPFVAPLLPLLPVGIALINGLLATNEVSFALDPFVVLIAVLCCNVLIELHFAVSVILQLATFLGIRPFIVPTI